MRSVIAVKLLYTVKRRENRAVGILRGILAVVPWCGDTKGKKEKENEF